MYPPNFGAINRGCAAFPDGAPEKMQFDDFFRVLMPDDLEGKRNVDPNVQFLEQFPSQTFLQCFALLTFAAGELPEAGEVHPCPAFGNEISAVVTDESGGYFDDLRHKRFLRGLNGNVLHIEVMGHPWHNGVLAVQQSAPKSIKAWLKS